MALLMDIMAITAVIPIMTIIAWMATMSLIISVNMRVVILGYVIDSFLYWYGYNGSSGHNRYDGHIGCYLHIVLMTKHSLIALIDVLSFMTLIAVIL